MSEREENKMNEKNEKNEKNEANEKNEKEELVNLVNKEKLDIADLLAVMRILRSDGGCPWDIEQTHASLRKNLVEETYEVCEAIDNSDMTLLREELGDLLFQVVFHARIAEENGLFDFDDIVNDICRKMIVRHDHVFGNTHYQNLDEQLSGWDAIKMQTKNQNSTADALDGVARTLPSLMRAQKFAHKLARAGKNIGETAGPDKMDGREAAKQIFSLCAACDRTGLDAEREVYDLCEEIIRSTREEETVNK